MWKVNIFLHVVSQVWMSEGFRGLFPNSLIAWSQLIAGGFPFISSWIWITQDSLGFPGLILKSLGRDGAAKWDFSLLIQQLLTPGVVGSPGNCLELESSVGWCLVLSPQQLHPHLTPSTTSSQSCAWSCHPLLDGAGRVRKALKAPRSW